MNWGELFNTQTLLALGVPVGIGLLVMIVLYILRRYLFKLLHKLTSKTSTCFDDIMMHNTRIPTLLWCIWLGIYIAYRVADTPAAWMVVEKQLIPVLFVAFGVYTLIMIIMATFQWYKKEICPKTSSSLDDAIMGTLIVGTPIVGGCLGIILILNMLDIYSTAVNQWLGDHGLKIAILLIVMITLVLLIILIVPKFVDRTVRNAKIEQSEEEAQKRSDTLVSVIVTALQITIIFMFILMILSEIGINIAAMLTGAGVLGVAIGLGAQSLVKDILAGLFIIMENQYRKGDVIKIAGVSGTVEEINLRRTILRDVDGVYHVVPNSQIGVSSNYTKQWSRVNLNISVSYETNLDKAIAVINRVGKEMAEDPVWMNMLVSPPKALRVDNLGDSGIDIKITGETKPSRQWEVAGELRLRLKKAFDKEGISIPYPHTEVVFSNLPPQLISGKPGIQEVKEENNLETRLNN